MKIVLPASLADTSDMFGIGYLSGTVQATVIPTGSPTFPFGYHVKCAGPGAFRFADDAHLLHFQKLGFGYC